MNKFLIVVIGLIFLAGCKEEKKVPGTKEVVIKEVYQTKRNHSDNVDSPAFWSDGKQNLIIATAKESHKLLVYNAENGDSINAIGQKGSGEKEFLRPNGISVVDNYLLVVERDNKRIQVLSLPEFNFVGFISDSLLTKPYGLNIIPTSENNYRLFVTDNYETKTEEVPADSLLGNRIHIYDLMLKNDSLDYKVVKFAGATEGKSVLRIVESVFYDKKYDNLLISEEDETQSSVKVYDFEGNSKNKIFGLGLFNYQVEGITLCNSDDSKGFWIITDQSMEKNRFMIFDRETFEYKGAFIGENTLNTDGVWLTQKAFGKFKEGAFFAVHDDGNISVFDLIEIKKSLNL